MLILNNNIPRPLGSVRVRPQPANMVQASLDISGGSEDIAGICRLWFTTQLRLCRLTRAFSERLTYGAGNGHLGAFQVKLSRSCIASSRIYKSALLVTCLYLLPSLHPPCCLPWALAPAATTTSGLSSLPSLRGQTRVRLRSCWPLESLSRAADASLAGCLTVSCHVCRVESLLTERVKADRARVPAHRSHCSPQFLPGRFSV